MCQISCLRTQLEATTPAMVLHLWVQLEATIPVITSPEAVPPGLVIPIQKPQLAPAESLTRAALAWTGLKSELVGAKPLTLAIPVRAALKRPLVQLDPYQQLAE